MSHLTRRQLLGSTAASVAGFALLNAGQATLAARQATPTASPVASPAVISTTALDDLRSRLKGTLILPGDSAYATASEPANGRYDDIRPAAIARVADEDDVITCIQWCTENGVSPVGRGGGHSYAGFSTTTGLLLDLRRLNHVVVDRNEGTVVCGGAALNNDYFIATEDGPLFLPGGTCLGVGVGGLTLGGGIGYNAHWAGLTCDHMIHSRIVTADGQVREISPSSEEDLYWACRGGAGGSFGINTEFTFTMVEVPQQEIGWFRYEWMGADAAVEAMQVFHQVLAGAPQALNAVVMTEATDQDPDPRKALHTMTRGAYIGPVDELAELVAPLTAIGNKTVDTLESAPFWAIQRLIATQEPEQHNFGDMSRFANDVPADDLLADIVDLVADCPQRTEDANGSFWSLGWVSGKVADYGRTDTAYVHRDALTLLRPTTVWPDGSPAAVGDELNAWTKSVIDLISPSTPDQSYQNFPNRDLERYLKQYYAENLDRLVDVKTAVDPTNMFNNPQSVPTREGLAAMGGIERV